jgi:hypothetical protein
MTPDSPIYTQRELLDALRAAHEDERQRADAEIAKLRQAHAQVSAASRFAWFALGASTAVAITSLAVMVLQAIGL